MRKLGVIGRHTNRMLVDSHIDKNVKVKNVVIFLVILVCLSQLWAMGLQLRLKLAIRVCN